jgi:hypothetical protein
MAWDVFAKPHDDLRHNVSPLCNFHQFPQESQIMAVFMDGSKNATWLDAKDLGFPL